MPVGGMEGAWGGRARRGRASPRRSGRQGAGGSSARNWMGSCIVFHWACRGGDVQIVKLLVDAGARINAKDKVRTKLKNSLR